MVCVGQSLQLINSQESVKVGNSTIWRKEYVLCKLLVIYANRQIFCIVLVRQGPVLRILSMYVISKPISPFFCVTAFMSYVMLCGCYSALRSYLSDKALCDICQLGQSSTHSNYQEIMKSDACLLEDNNLSG